MATANLSDFVRRLTRGMAAEMLGDHSDRQLVETALATRDEAAFQAIVFRHGAMVYRVCWRVLQHPQDAEDAFQATFLILAQKLSSLRKYASLASWLHGVAHRVAVKARHQAAARRRRESQAPLSEAMPPDDATWKDIRSVLDAELDRLPDKWRLPLVLCYLEERTQDEAASQLTWSKSTLRRRLEEARRALGQRLSRRGIGCPAALSAVLFSDCLAQASPTAGLVASTVEAATGVAVGKPVTTAVSAKVTALTKGVLKTMFLTKLNTAALVFLTLALLASVIGMLALPAVAEQEGAKNGAAGPPVQETKTPKLDLSRMQVEIEPKTDLQRLHGAWTLVEMETRGKKLTGKDMTYGGAPLKSLKLVIDGKKIPKLRKIPAAQVTDPNDRLGGVDVQFGDNPPAKGDFLLNETKKPKRITMAWLFMGWESIYKVEGDTLTICFNPENYIRPDEFRTTADSERVLFVFQRTKASPAQEKPGDAPQPKEAKEESKAEKTVEGKLVKIEAEGVRLEYLKVVKGDGRPYTQIAYVAYETFPVAKDAVILQDNLKTKIADLKIGNRVTVKLCGEKAVSVLVDGGTVQGRYVSANTARNTIAVLAGKKNEKKIYHLVKETEVLTETGKAIQVKDLKEGTLLLLTLSVEDPNTVIRIQPLPLDSHKKK